MARKAAGKVSKPSKRPSRASVKTTRAQIHSLNADTKQIEEITLLLHTSAEQKPKKTVLDAQQLQQDLKKDKENAALNLKEEKQVEEQIDLLVGMAL